MGRCSRRRLLAGLGTAAVGGLAGCSGDGGGNGTGGDYPTLQYGEWYTEQPVFDYSVENYRTTEEVFYTPENRTLSLGEDQMMAVVTCKVRNTDDRARDMTASYSAYFFHYNNPEGSDRIYLDSYDDISHPTEGDISDYRPLGVGELQELPFTLEPNVTYSVDRWGVGRPSVLEDPKPVYLTTDDMQFTRTAVFRPSE